MKAAGHLVLLVVSLAGCGWGKADRARADSTEIAARQARLASKLADAAGPTDEPIAKWILTAEFAEISGLALNQAGTHILVHGDESSEIAVVDYRTGVITKRFHVGDRPIIGDFEGITRVDSTYHMMTSKGEIYAFTEGEQDEGVPFTVTDTKLAAECEFEGIGYDPAINALLLPCKFPKKSMSDSLVIYRWPLGPNPGAVSRLTVPLADVIGANDWEEVSPSDIVVDPFTGNYVITTAREVALIVITPTGEVVSAGPIPTGIPHVEGVGITADSLLILSAELGDAPQSITLFRWRPSGARIAATDTTGGIPGRVDSVRVDSTTPSPKRQGTDGSEP